MQQFLAGYNSGLVPKQFWADLLRKCAGPVNWFGPVQGQTDLLNISSFRKITGIFLSSKRNLLENHIWLINILPKILIFSHHMPGSTVEHETPNKISCYDGLYNWISPVNNCSENGSIVQIRGEWTRPKNQNQKKNEQRPAPKRINPLGNCNCI